MPPSSENFALDPQGRQPIVGIVVDRLDWHARQLAAAFGARGIRAVPVRLNLCAIVTPSVAGLQIDGFGESLPDAVIVRDMSAGTFQAVTLRLGILHAMRERGVPVWNDARAIERCVDKSMTSFLLARAGIPTPATWATESHDAAELIAKRECATGPLVLKPLFGSQGRGLRLIRAPEDLPQPEEVTGVYYLQRFVGVERDGFHDFRLFVVQGRVVAAMQRHSTHWITNVKRGGRPVAAVVNDDMAALALRAVAAIGADFAGVDIVFGPDQRPTVLEVNSMPAWSGLQKVTAVNLATVLVENLIAAGAADLARGVMA
jgi:tetrahydromethanopterin:alpha-L-glutamate ligase